MSQTMQYFAGQSRPEISKVKLFYLEWRNLTNERGILNPSRLLWLPIELIAAAG